MEHLYNLFLHSTGITTDSRRVESGMLFFALRGDNFDGNAYANKALAAGASCAVVDDPTVMIGCAGYFLCDDVLTTLQDLATYHRERLSIPIIGLTGSNGKTTTKEFLKLALGVKYKVGATHGNLNNHIGVPLTLLSLDRSVDIAIVEMGANHQGEIARLCQIAQPVAGLITNIGRAHLDGFGGELGVRKGKGELYDYLQLTDGVALYNADDALLSEMLRERPSLVGVAYDSRIVESPIFGAYNATNASAAVAVAQYYGVDRHSAIDAVMAYVPSNNRSQVICTERGNRVVVDCYNANPSSMAVALDEFEAMPSPEGRSKIYIIGEMRELGSYSAFEHQLLVDRLSGRDAMFVGQEFRDAAPWFSSTDELASYLIQNPLSRYDILLKGSRSVGLESLLSVL